MDRFSILLKKPVPVSSAAPKRIDIKLGDSGSILNKPVTTDDIVELRRQIDRAVIDPNFSVFTSPSTVATMRVPLDIQTIHPQNGDMFFVGVPNSWNNEERDSLGGLLYDHFRHLNVQCEAVVYPI